MSCFINKIPLVVHTTPVAIAYGNRIVLSHSLFRFYVGEVATVVRYLQGIIHSIMQEQVKGMRK